MWNTDLAAPEAASARALAAGAAGKRSGRSNKATVRVLGVLSRFIGHRSSWGVTELSQDLGLSKNMVHRALSTLLEQGYVVRDASGARYEIGTRVLELGAGQLEEPDVRALCGPAMRQLHQLTGESVFLSIIVGRNHVTIDSVEAHGVKVSNPRGLPVPLHASPASRALLSFLSDEEIEQYLRVAAPLKRFTEATLADPAAVREEVQRVRRQRYARGYGDHTTGATYIAFPVLDANGRPHAALTVGGPPGRFTQARVDELLPRMLEIMDEANRRSRLFPAAFLALFD
jgi:IclR family transcriptional regulator, KDG regulon repressor